VAMVRTDRAVFDNSVLHVAKDGVVDAWQAWRLGDHGPFYIVPTGSGEATASITRDPRGSSIPGDELIAGDPVDEAHLSKDNLATYYWWRDQISLVDSIERDVDGKSNQITIEWISNEQWQVFVDVSPVDADEPVWVPDERYSSQERAEYVASQVCTNPAKVERNS